MPRRKTSSSDLSEPSPRIKPPHLIIEAARRLPDLPADFIFYGSDPPFSRYPDQLRQWIAGDERFQFCGTFAHDRIGEILAGIDVLIVPSIWHENTPLVVQEAQAAGCAVVASDRGGLSEIEAATKLMDSFFPPAMEKRLPIICRIFAATVIFASQLANSARPPMSISQQVDRLEILYSSEISTNSSVSRSTI